MKNLSKLPLYVILLVSFVFSNFVFADEEKYRIAVSELVVSNAVSATNAKIIKDSNLIQEIESRIRNSRKFELLSRNASVLKTLRTEQEFAAGELTEKDGTVEEGRLKTAQSLLIIEVNSFSLGHSAKKLPRVDKYEVSNSANISLTVQLMDTSTGTINASFPVTVSARSGTQIQNSASGSAKGLLPKVIKDASNNVSIKLFEAIFPMQVIAISGNQFYINRGQDSGISVGQLFEIFEKGESLIDPDTGEDLGTTETKIGVGKVVSIKPKVTVLEMKSGKISDVKKGCLARKPQ